MTSPMQPPSSSHSASGLFDFTGKAAGLTSFAPTSAPASQTSMPAALLRPQGVPAAKQQNGSITTQTSQQQQLDRLSKLPRELREKSRIVREAVASARARVGASSLYIQEVVEKAQKEAEAAAVASQAASVAELELEELQKRLHELHLEEGQAVHSEEMDFLTSQRAKISERSHDLSANALAFDVEVEAVFASSCELSTLRAEVFDEERRLQDLMTRVAALNKEATEPSSPDEQLHFEWYGMSAEDRPEAVAEAKVVADCDIWERRLHEAVAPVAFAPATARRSTPDEGVERLENDLDCIGLTSRARRASTSECLERLAQDSGPWSEHAAALQQAYSVLERLRRSSERLSEDLLACRECRSRGCGRGFEIGGGAHDVDFVDASPGPIRRGGSTSQLSTAALLAPFAAACGSSSQYPPFSSGTMAYSAPASVFGGSAPTSPPGGPSPSYRLPPGPSFAGPPLLGAAPSSKLQSPPSSSSYLGRGGTTRDLAPDGFGDNRPGMPQAVISGGDRGAWEASAMQPRAEAASGLLSLLCGPSQQTRFRPGRALTASGGFDYSPGWGDFAASGSTATSPGGLGAAFNGGEGGTPSSGARRAPHLEIGDLSRWAEAQFRQPLSEVLGIPPQKQLQRRRQQQCAEEVAPPENNFGHSSNGAAFGDQGSGDFAPPPMRSFSATAPVGRSRASEAKKAPRSSSRTSWVTFDASQAPGSFTATGAAQAAGAGFSSAAPAAMPTSQSCSSSLRGLPKAAFSPASSSGYTASTVQRALDPAPASLFKRRVAAGPARARDAGADSSQGKWQSFHKADDRGSVADLIGGADLQDQVESSKVGNSGTTGGMPEDPPLDVRLGDVFEKRTGREGAVVVGLPQQLSPMPPAAGVSLSRTAVSPFGHDWGQ